MERLGRAKQCFARTAQHMLRLQLKAQGIDDDSWQTLREVLATQQRVTATLQRRDGRAVHVRKATRPEPQH